MISLDKRHNTVLFPVLVLKAALAIALKQAKQAPAERRDLAYQVPGEGMHVGEWKWVQAAERHLEESEFLNEHETAAKVGKVTGRVALTVASGAGVAYLGATAAAANVGTWVAGQQAAMAVAAPSAGLLAQKAAYEVGKGVGEKARGALLSNLATSAWTLGGLAGAYAGAGCEAGLDWLANQLP
ncbi:hypothetical protein [Streptomyces sp. NRRL S-920]|uniref:hypothetical protein n=1 Tax=Streptomyces sp. NRRL S-920 TaxID=1463921 RepID=UPI00131DF33F|nr:hypothetical protein [Streptomyces sp. NRRL S-920]